MNVKGKSIDNTFLSIDTAERRGFIHRDYIAHCFRWSHFVKRLTDRSGHEWARVLDVGCGREMPLPKLLYSSRIFPAHIYAVEHGPIDDEAMDVFKTGKFPLTAYERTDICNITTRDLGDQRATHIACFEMLEHIEPAHVRRVLTHLKTLLDPSGVAYFSTPCWDVVSCAGNHVNEMRFHALGKLFEDLGWTIVQVNGTFASIRDYEAHLTAPEREVFTKLRGYYDVNVLACIFAPMYPQYSRNCIWEVRPIRTVDGDRKFLGEVQRPWTSSERWQELFP